MVASKKQDSPLGCPVPAVSVPQGRDHQQAELTALNAGARPPWTGDDRQKAQALFACLKQRRIAIKSTFYKMLGMAPLAQRSKLVSRCQVFFDSVDTKEISNTSCLTSMIQKKAHVSAFLLHSDDTVRRVAKTPVLRSLTSLFNKRGFPRAEEDTQAFMEWEIWWWGEGQARTLDRELLRAFSSMFHKRGLPDKKVVNDYLQWNVWWQDEGKTCTLDRELLRTFSSMFCGRGLPDKKAVEDYLQLDLWRKAEGKGRTLDRKLLRAFSSMFHNRGLPDKFRTDEILQWLTRDKQWNRSAIKVMARLYSGAYAGHGSLGLPDIGELRQAEQKLMALVPTKEHDEDDELLPLIKIVALYLANDGGTRQLSWTDCKVWFREYSDFLAKKDVLRRLLLTLHYHGGRGVKEAMALISGRPDATKQFVLNALSRGKALAAVQYALEAIEPSEWWEYLFFTRELHPVPSCQQWQTIKGYLKALALIWSNQEHQRRFLTLIWPLSPADQEQFMQPEALRELITLLPSVQVMRQLSKSLTTAELRTLFDTCLAYRKGQPDKRGLPISATDAHLIPPHSPATWLGTVLRQSVLSEADIDQLYTYRDQLTSDQVVDILFRMEQSVSQDTTQRWYSLLGDKHQQTLKTHPPWLDGSDQTMEAMHDVEDILRDLFPNALL